MTLSPEAKAFADRLVGAVEEALMAKQNLGKCKWCEEYFKPEPDTPKEHKGLCRYCRARFELISYARNEKGKEKARSLTNEQIDRGIMRAAKTIMAKGISPNEIPNRIPLLARILGEELEIQLAIEKEK